ncbi:MAG: uridine kinase [Patescibacteria group bacterium]|nr:uridine kinase [Patescibacteria group bacterium]
MIEQPTIFDLIILAGASGSGKGEVAKRIKAEIGDEYVGHNEFDMLYFDRSDMPKEERDKLDFDDPNDSLDWFEVIHFAMCLKEGKTAILPVYDFNTHTRIAEKSTTVQPKRFNLLDSHMGLWHPRLRALARKKIFVETDLDICAFRRQARDTLPIEEGGRGRTNESVREQWPKVREAYKLHFEPTKRWADIIVPGGGENFQGIEFITNWMKYQLLIETQQKSKRSHKKKN